MPMMTNKGVYMKITEVVYDMAEPAKKMDIIKWLLTGGRYGKLFIKVPRRFNKYWAELDNRCTPPLHINCRSTILKGKIGPDGGTKS